MGGGPDAQPVLGAERGVAGVAGGVGEVADRVGREVVAADEGVGRQVAARVAVDAAAVDDRAHVTALAGEGALAAVGVIAAAVAAAEDATFTQRLLTPETALKAAQAALARCRSNGFQVAVAVVDRAGVVQVLLRDRFAGPHTPETATGKAWTAVSFRTSTTELAEATQAGRAQSGLRGRPGVVAVGGEHFTNDIAVGLRMPIPDAEKLKRRSGCALTALVAEHDTMEVASIAGRRARMMPRRVLSEILQPRAEEICHLFWDEIRRAGYEKSLNSGIVITGGAALLEGAHIPGAVLLPDRLRVRHSWRTLVAEAQLGAQAYRIERLVQGSFLVADAQIWRRPWRGVVLREAQPGEQVRAVGHQGCPLQRGRLREVERGIDANPRSGKPQPPRFLGGVEPEIKPGVDR